MNVASSFSTNHKKMHQAIWYSQGSVPESLMEKTLRVGHFQQTLNNFFNSTNFQRLIHVTNATILWFVVNL